MLRLTDSPFWEAMVRSNLATTRFELNDLDGAREAAERVLALGPDSAPVAPRTAARLALIRMHIARADWDAADEQVRLAREDLGGLGGREGLATAVRTAMGELALGRGDADGALRLAEEGLENAQFAEKPVHIALLRLRGLALGKERLEEARAVLNDVRNMSRVMEMRLEEARTLVAIGSRSVSDEALSDAEEIFTTCGCTRGLVEVAEARRQLLRA
ncbi:MAG: tetratricopeptide repeat protein [Actinomycetota bacterium]